VWQIRHGGRLFSAFPFLLAAEQGLDDILPRLPAFTQRARELALSIATLDDVAIVPDPPQTAMFHVLVRRPLEPLRTAALTLADETKVWLAAFKSTSDPGVQMAELTITEASYAVAPAEARSLWQRLLDESARAPAG
jgi:hypothetical protein